MAENKTTELAESTVASAAATLVSSKVEASKLPLSPDGSNVRALTTLEEDLRTKGQRRINLIWELTQAVIAVAITISVIYAALAGKASEVLSNAFTLIIAVYFVRMNHIKIGGVGGTDDSR